MTSLDATISKRLWPRWRRWRIGMGQSHVVVLSHLGHQQILVCILRSISNLLHWLCVICSESPSPDSTDGLVEPAGIYTEFSGCQCVHRSELEDAHHSEGTGYGWGAITCKGLLLIKILTRQGFSSRKVRIQVLLVTQHPHKTLGCQGVKCPALVVRHRHLCLWQAPVGCLTFDFHSFMLMMVLR